MTGAGTILQPGTEAKLEMLCLSKENSESKNVSQLLPC